MDENSALVDEEKFIATKMPVCPECGCVSRPNIMMFYDYEFNPKRTWAQRKRYEAWLNENENSKIAIIEIGAGLAVPTIRKHGEALVKRFKNATIIRINPKDSSLNSQLGISLKLGGLEALNQIL